MRHTETHVNMQRESAFTFNHDSAGAKAGAVLKEDENMKKIF